MATKKEEAEAVIIRDLSGNERMIVIANSKFGFYTTVDSLHVRSVKPLQDEQIEAALRELQRKIQSLRLIIKKRGSTFYYQEMAVSSIDYKRIEDSDWINLHNHLTETVFDLENGPLWNCRLLALDKSSPDAQLGVPSSMPEPYVIIFTHHHAITDGRSNVQTYGHFIRILNNIISNDKTEEDKIFFPESFEKAVGNEMWIKPRDYKLILRGIRGLISPRNNIFTQKFGVHESLNAKTRVLFRPISLEDSQRFIQKCKSSGATFHGAFTLLAALAMADMINGSESLPNDVNFQVLHAVDGRKYVDGDMDNIHAQYSSGIVDDFTLKKGTRERFWEYAKVRTEEIHYDLKARTMQGERFLHYGMKFPEFILERNKTHGYSEFEFGTTNLGRIDRWLDTNTEHVEVVTSCRSASYQHMSVMVVHTIQTLKGMICYSMDYMTNYISTDLATKYADKVVQTLVEIARL